MPTPWVYDGDPNELLQRRLLEDDAREAEAAWRVRCPECDEWASRLEGVCWKCGGLVPALEEE